MKNEDFERKKDELRKIIYEEDYPNISEKTYKKKKKRPIFTNILLSLMLVCGLFFSGFLIIDSSKRVNELYEVINAVLFFLIILSVVISFPKAFFKKKTGATIFLSFTIIITVIFNFLYLFGIINLPTQSHMLDYTNRNLTSVIEWLDKNKIEYDEKFEYSDTTSRYNIISQSVKPYTLAKNIKDVKLVVSKGPDYDKEVIIPNQNGMKTGEILDFVDENYLKNVHIIFEENNEISNDVIIKQSSVGKIKRSDSYIYTASLGIKEELPSIKAKNLKGEKLLSAEMYLGKNGILYELKYEYSSSVSRGCVISSNVKEGTTLKADDKVILTISKGKEIKIPKLKGMSLKEITKWVTQNNLYMQYSDAYDSQVKKGRVISSNYKEGDIIEEETLINIVFSKGKLVLPKFNSLSSFKTWADNYKIKYEIKEEFNKDVNKDEIIKFSIKEGEKIDLRTPLIVYVSKGEAVKVTDFTGKSKDEAKKECDNLGIVCLFYNTLSDKFEGTVLSQSVAAGMEISKGSNVDIEISTKKQSQVTTRKSTSTSQSQGTTSSHSTEEEASQSECINASYISASGNNGDQSIVLMKKYNSKLNISFNAESSCSNGSIASGSICFAQNLTTGAILHDGDTVSTCDSIAVHYIK